jgi:hypothetical protein
MIRCPTLNQSPTRIGSQKVDPCRTLHPINYTFLFALMRAGDVTNIHNEALFLFRSSDKEPENGCFYGGN